MDAGTRSRAARRAAGGLGPRASRRVRKRQEPPIAKEVDQLGFYSAALEAAKILPKEKVTIEELTDHPYSPAAAKWPNVVTSLRHSAPDQLLSEAPCSFPRSNSYA